MTTRFSSAPSHTPLSKTRHPTTKCNFRAFTDAKCLEPDFTATMSHFMVAAAWGTWPSPASKMSHCCISIHSELQIVYESIQTHRSEHTLSAGRKGGLRLKQITTPDQIAKCAHPVTGRDGTQAVSGGGATSCPCKLPFSPHGQTPQSPSTPLFDNHNSLFHT